MAYLGNPTAPDTPYYLETWAKYLRGFDPKHRPIITKEPTSRDYSAVQEVIVQNFRAKPDTVKQHTDDLAVDEYRAAIAVTRLVLGPKAASRR